MKLNDSALGALVLFCGLLIYASALRFSAIPGQAYGADTMPKAIALLASGVGAFMIAKSFFSGFPRPMVSASDWMQSRPAIARLSVALGMVVFYIVLSPIIGFIFSAMAVLLILMLALGTKPLTAVVASIIGSLLIQQAFGRLLLVPLPRNPLLDFLW